MPATAKQWDAERRNLASEAARLAESMAVAARKLAAAAECADLALIQLHAAVYAPSIADRAELLRRIESAIRHDGMAMP